MHPLQFHLHPFVRALACASIATTASAQCFDWASGFTPAGIAGSVYDQVVFDDGSGSGDELYVGGTPLIAGDVEAQGIAKWNGARWAPVATTLTAASYSPEVNALEVFDDGNGAALYAAGYFTSIDGVPATNIAKWNGSNWSPVGGGINTSVLDMVVFDDGNGPALYVGASSNSTAGGGVPVHGIAKWNGTSWSSIAASFTHSLGPFVRRMAVADDGSGPALFIGGRFSAIDGVPANYIAKWNGVSWSALGTGLSEEAYALIGWDDGSGPALFAGGSFSYAGGNQITRIAKWRNGAWSPVGGGLVQYVYGFALYDDGNGEQLYVGGQLNVVGATPWSYGIARWNGASWSKPTNGAGLTVNGNVSFVTSMAVYDDGNGPGLYASGPFDRADGLIAQHIARFDNGGWHALGAGNTTSGPLHALHAFDDGSGAALYAGGSFSAAGTVVADSIARFDGSSWSVVGNGFNCNGTVTTLADFDDGSGPALYAGGSFTEIDGTVAHRMAKFDGTSWSALGIGLGNASDTTVNDMLVYDDGSGPALLVAGKFQFAGGNSARRIARWNGSTWSTLGTGFDAQVNALAAFDDGSGTKLYAGGSYQHADGNVVLGIASWNGAAWSPVASGMNAEVTALPVFHDGTGSALYAAGYFTNAGGVAAQRFAKWNGSSWSQVGGGVNGITHDFEVFDDGHGPALYLTGTFSMVGGSLPIEGIARWNGAQWSALGSGIDRFDIETLTVFDDGNGAALFAGGSFAFAGRKPSLNIAKWARACGCSPVSYCTAGTSSNGCTPTMSASGTPSASGTGSFVVTASNVEGQKLGLLFYGMSGATSSPWGATSSFLCVKPPQQRTGQTSTGGTSGACDGALVLDFNAYVASHPSSLGQPFSVGDTVRMQGWYRDPPNPKTTSLTNALEFYVCP